MLIDTHCHFSLMLEKSASNSTEIHSAIQKIIDDAKADQVSQFVTIGTNLSDSKQGYALAQTYAPIYASIGLHPTDYHALWRNDLMEYEKIIHRAEPTTVVAIGECGIDLYHKNSTLPQQQDLFRAQIELALTHNLPLVIHSRDAAEETLDCLDEFKDSQLRGVMHCFSYDLSIAQEVLQRNFRLGIGGTVTYPKNEVLRAIVTTVPLNTIVLETDAPFLPPQPWRGKPNHPRYIKYIAEYIAELRKISFEEVAAETTHTAQQLFNLPTQP